MSSSRPSRGGFTLIEAAFAVALASILLFKLMLVLSNTSEAYEQESRMTELEDQANRVLDRIQLAIMGSSRSSLNPSAFSPLFSQELRYELNLGVQNGQTVWGDEERIGTDPSGTQVVWSERPGQPNERSVVWSKRVRALHATEIDDGLDNNGNSIVDETGLSFVVDGNMVTIYLTLERPGVDGQMITFTRDVVATCRN